MSPATVAARRAPRRAVTPKQLGIAAKPPRTAATDPIGQHLRAWLHAQVHAQLRYEPGCRSGRDPEDLHQMRVAVRRMRAVLNIVPDSVPGTGTLRAELGWLGAALGPVRDLDVLIDRVRAQSHDFTETERAAVENLIAGLVVERSTARRRLVSVLNSVRYSTLLRALAAAVTSPLPVEPGQGLTHLARKPYRKLRRAVEALPDDPSDEALHELRILGKRLRYASELAGPVAGKQARKLLTATKQFQDVLGEHQDACVAGQQVRRLLAERAGAVPWDLAFVAGRLVEREHVRRVLRRAMWPQAWVAVETSAALLL